MGLCKGKCLGMNEFIWNWCFNNWNVFVFFKDFNYDLLSVFVCFISYCLVYLLIGVGFLFLLLLVPGPGEELHVQADSIPSSSLMTCQESSLQVTNLTGNNWALIVTVSGKHLWKNILCASLNDGHLYLKKIIVFVHAILCCLPCKGLRQSSLY